MPFSVKIHLSYALVLGAAFLLGLTCLGVLEGQREWFRTTIGSHVELERAVHAAKSRLIEHEESLASGAPAEAARTGAGVAAAADAVALWAARAGQEARGAMLRKAILDGLNRVQPTRRVLGAIEGEEAPLAEALRQVEEAEKRLYQRGLALVVGAGGLLLIVVLGLRKWLFLSTVERLEGFAKGLESIASGNLDRRVHGGEERDIFGEIAAGINELAHRLQRACAAPRGDILASRAALEVLLEGEERAAGVLTPDHRLLAANEKARALVLARRMPFHRIAAQAVRDGAATGASVVDLTGSGGERLGSLVRLGEAAGPVERGQVPPSGPS